MSALKKIDPISVPAVESNLALFDILPTNVAYNRTFVRELLPIMTVTREGPYTFRLFSDSLFVDFSKTWFYLKSSMEKMDANGRWVKLSNDEDDDKYAGVIQNYTHSFIKQLKLTINGTKVFNSGVLYPWRSYIATEYGKPYGFRKGILQASGYYHDENLESADQDGHIMRSKMFSGGKQNVSMAMLNFDLANQNNLFVNNCDILFEIWPQKDDFIIFKPDYPVETEINIDRVPATGNTAEIPARKEKRIISRKNDTSYRIVVHEVKLYCTLVDVVQSLQNQIARTLESMPAKYLLRKVELRHLYLPEGTSNISWNVFSSVVPRRLMVFLINNTAFNGVPDKNPFMFEHGNIESIWIESNNLIVPDYPYRFNFDEDDGNWVRAFIDFYSGLDLIDPEREIFLGLQQYKKGWTGWVFPLASSHRDTGDSFELIKNGTTVIKATFSKPVPAPGYICLAVGEFDEVLTVNANRVLSVDGAI